MPRQKPIGMGKPDNAILPVAGSLAALVILLFILVV